jgi:RimJ/RimL family protein N-acetyltransferase
MNLEFRKLTQVNPDDIIALNNHPDVLRHMPLGAPDFDRQKCLEWAAQKDAQWQQHGYGPWAFMIDGHFAGWGGLQYEDGDADLALVLHPDYWGAGKIIYDEIVNYAFSTLKLESITILLPLSRVKIKTILRLGFHPDGEMIFDNICFRRFRLFATAKNQ